MKWFAFPAALLVFATTAAFADTLPDQVRAEASRLLEQVNGMKVVASSRPALKPAALSQVLVIDLQRFGMSASRLSLEIDKTGGPTDLRCIFRGMAEETDVQLKAASNAATGAQQAVALDRLSHMLQDAVEIAPAVGSQTKTAANPKVAAATCPAVRDF
ncbi:MAG: hypothetical protein Q8R02_13705 [Hyphomonadaceae bacterium]|nr:hypothetical protein [Hyphomonadaceae bacterium]